MELYDFILINGSDCLVECASGGSECSVQCASGMKYLMCGGTPWAVPIKCDKNQGPNCKKTEVKALAMHR
jgi:hypothetical protein